MTRPSRRAFVAGAAASFVAPAVVKGQNSPPVVIGLPSTSLGSAMPRLTHEMGIYLKNGVQTRLTVLESAKCGSRKRFP